MDLNLRTPRGRRLQRRCFGRLHTRPSWLRERDLNPRPLGYEPSELPLLHRRKMVRRLNSVALSTFIRSNRNATA